MYGEISFGSVAIRRVLVGCACTEPFAIERVTVSRSRYSRHPLINTPGLQGVESICEDCLVGSITTALSTAARRILKRFEVDGSRGLSKGCLTTGMGNLDADCSGFEVSGFFKLGFVDN